MLRTKKKKNQSTSSVNKLLLFEMDCNQNSQIIDLSLDEVSGYLTDSFIIVNQSTDRGKQKMKYILSRPLPSLKNKIKSLPIY